MLRYSIASSDVRGVPSKAITFSAADIGVVVDFHLSIHARHRRYKDYFLSGSQPIIRMSNLQTKEKYILPRSLTSK
jgi:hypothetical protein